VRSLAEVIALPPSPRLAARLISLAAPKRAPAPVTISISQQALGELIGLTRKTVNRVLADFEHKGLVRIGYGQLELLDLGGLERAANA
jgi:CRP/FNR family cyclic AMP-dependent transcriptional regulator